MILMAIVMVAPLLALPLFYYFPVGIALPIYILIVAASVYCDFIMFWSMRAKARSGMKAMIGERALAIEDIAPEGKVEVWGEIWTAVAANKPIPVGRKVKILDARGLVLIVDAFKEDEDD
jgi:membrane-bound ClpP family serine protease